MEFENRDEFIIKKYQQDEAVMIQVFVNWATRNQLDPVGMYQRAYPSQIKNEALLLAVDEADPFEMEVGDDTLLELLQMFGNDDLAFIVSEEMEKIARK
ncbi:hypothetical protein DHX103_09370 [Planococcus sp. X10-3]|uniref:hypothetical protein n=1 Tax=Planococcus sp. X10-3 TaxID=3061240 RepID=UPI003BB13778